MDKAKEYLIDYKGTKKEMGVGGGEVETKSVYYSIRVYSAHSNFTAGLVRLEVNPRHSM
jgi:hypothetical protein